LVVIDAPYKNFRARIFHFVTDLHADETFQKGCSPLKRPEIPLSGAILVQKTQSGTKILSGRTEKVKKNEKSRVQYVSESLQSPPLAHT